ncbi:hypothetical protein BJY52DRAFT_1289594 [Lactarius psammicola]|nr:hypothetical protein BJY52DRAFT_1289594 [Lactarius psammicola]
MTAPTQELPSWLSLSTSLATNAAGQPTGTFTTLIYLPLTYYGPPIPLGSDGVWYPPLHHQLYLLPITLPLPPTTPTTVPASTSSSVPVSGDLSSRSNRTGVIIGSVLGSVLGSLLLLCLFICFFRKRQRNQQQRNRRPESPRDQVIWMWHDVRGNDYDQDADLDAQLRSPGEGSPTGSGDERDAFLRRSGDAPDSSRNGEPTARLVDAPRSSQDSSGRPIGIALAAGAGAMASAPFEYKSPRPSGTTDGGRHIISREQLAGALASPQSPEFPKSPEEVELGPDAPLLPPPAFNLNVSHSSRKSLLPRTDTESAMLYTAQRVRVGRNPVPSSSAGTSWPEAIGIPSILRRSWLSPRTRSATPTTPSSKSSLLARQLTDNELEAGRSLNAQLRAEMGYRDGARPVSGVSTGSARSGNTVFYDAHSREDVSFTPPPVPPLPQGTASTGRSDAPVPRPASPFASVSSAKGLSPPPGLSLPVPHVWRDSATSPSNTSGGAIDIDLLEEAPPAAGESWRQIAQGLPSLHERRTTFGMPLTLVHPRELTTSEQGSLHSMRSHLSPHSALSAAGSAPSAALNRSRTRARSPRPTAAFARPSPGEVSPALSATGRYHHHQQQQQHPHRVPAAPAQLPQSLVQSATVTSTMTTTTTTRSSVTTHTSVTDPITGEVSRVPHAAWTGGRERESAVPDAELGAWGEGWSSPSHLRILQNRVGGRDGASHA